MNNWIQFWSDVATVCAALIAISALAWSIRSFHQSASIVSYSELDRMYAELLHLGVENYHLRLGDSCARVGEQKEQYNTYAYMVWNFVETVHDRVFAKGSNSSEALRETWRHVIYVEHGLSGKWLGLNRGMFKPTFPTFIELEIKKRKDEQPAPGERWQSA